MKLDTKRTILIGFAFLAISAFWQMYDNIIPLILKYFFNIGDTLSGGIMALDNIFALFMLPIFGALSDKVSTNRGKRTPFILVGTILSVIFMMFLPIAANMRNLALFIVMLLLTLIAMSTYRSPAVSLMPDVTPKPLRSKGNAIINLMGAVGIILVLGLTMVLSGSKDNNTPNYIYLFLAVAAIMIIALVILLTKVDENRFVAERIALEKEYGIEDEVEDDGSGDAKLPADVKRSLIFLLLSVAFWFMAYNGVTTAFSKYATETWGMGGGSYAGAMMVASIGALISFVPVGIISSKLGRKKVILFGVILLALSWFVAFLFKTPNAGIYVVFVLVGVAWASINVNSYPMVVEMCKGSDIGKFTGYYYTFSMAAQVFTPILSGFFLEHVGYWTLFPYATIFSVVAFITMLQVKHGDSKPEAPKKGVEAFEDLDM
ncbi:MAG: SLC45 family MFS transporter [Clostridiales bacterium]|nr:SLC45 family MFS transporter [Clostridiales bacterium]